MVVKVADAKDPTAADSKRRLPTALPFVSVIIPVFNDGGRLASCLRALEDQTYPKDRYEVIVVDNGSAESVEPIVARFPQAWTAYEQRPGSYAARNKGISLAKGGVLAFTDADCTPQPDWIENGVRRLLRNRGCGLVAGKVQVYFRKRGRPTIVELYSWRTTLTQKKYLKQHRYGATANLFTFRSVFKRVGKFDESLKSSGDRKWGRMVSAAGYRLIFAEDVCVLHPARASLRDLLAKARRTTGGHFVLDATREQPLPDFLKRTLRDLKPPIRRMRSVFRGQRWPVTTKIGFCLVMLSVYYVRVFERVRLRLGGRSRR